MLDVIVLIAMAVTALAFAVENSSSNPASPRSPR